ncbi:substrate-binding domain-containing protein [Pseudogulbenkiania ferrooxidans]|uniref:Sucrose operon repressor n=1 Tax=Pseudogulbenkiania ferrooxidans EGD-HP2 TaxID=1388764 RepID=A0ABN0N4S3_9NEIS|nr:substrate-binding domain-containing protein [Pseudogulbenkiania ferrooxidans]ERE04596.1 sucrose operon repressor [Pseudogulbenkiania ferrooxidans EGD-HP2]
MSSFKRLTIDDIAALAGVSRTTASMVLNGHAERYRISPATVEKVEKAAREHHFEPSQQARSLRSRRSSSIGLVVPDLTNSTHAALAQALENGCRERGYQLLMVTSDEDPERESSGIGQLAARQVDGMIVVPCSGDAARYQPWTGRLPFVFADRHIPGSGIPSAVTDAGDSVARLLSPLLADGVDELAYFGGQPELSASRERLAGYRQALDAAGLAEGEGWVAERDFQRESGYGMMADWHARHGGYPRALFTASITLLEGVLSFIRERHRLREAPQYLLTFDDHPLLDCLPLPIDAIRQNSAALAEASLAQVLALLQGEALAERDLRVPASLNLRRLAV